MVQVMLLHMSFSHGSKCDKPSFVFVLWLELSQHLHPLLISDFAAVQTTQLQYMYAFLCRAHHVRTAACAPSYRKRL